jgi:hypothetical protein
MAVLLSPWASPQGVPDTLGSITANL